MKIKFLPLLAVFFAATSIMTSCLDNDVEQITYTSETSITGFSLGTLHIDRVGKDKNGEDSAYVDTLDCSNYPFTIDQINRTITNKDSLPVGTYIDKVITNITYDAGVLAYKPKGSDNDTIWTSTDSIDFTEPVEFKVYAYSGVEGKPYKVTINVHKQEPDTISWKKFDNNPFSAGNLSEQKAVYANGKVYVFGKNGNGTHIEFSDVSDDNPNSWTPVTTNITDVDTYSATAWAGNIYFLAGGTNKKLYKLDANTNDVTPVGAETFEMLIGGNDIKEELYAVINKISNDGVSNSVSHTYKNGVWTEDANPFTLFPAGKPFFSNTTTASYNSDITTTIALCNNPGTTDNDTTALVFNRMSSDNKWEERIQNLPLPNLENVTMIYYDGKLYAFGGKSKKPEVKPFSQFYCSTDNGLCWRPVTECMAFPAEVPDTENPNREYINFPNLYDTHHGNYSCAVTPKLENGTSRGNFIWIVWEDGSICRGRINRLGFTPKW